jgi:hypothetical protein
VTNPHQAARFIARRYRGPDLYPHVTWRLFKFYLFERSN